MRCLLEWTLGMKEVVTDPQCIGHSRNIVFDNQMTVVLHPEARSASPIFCGN
jgi:hypothetical protein